MESIESIVSVYNFSKNPFTCHNSIKTRKHKLLKTPQNARAFKHAARHVQQLCNSLSDTSGRQTPGNTITNATSHNAFLVEVNFLFTI